MVLSSVRSVVDDVTTKAILHVVEKKSENENRIRHNHRLGRPASSSSSNSSSLKEILPQIKRLIYIALSCVGLFLAACYTYAILYIVIIPKNYATIPIHFNYNWKPSHQHHQHHNKNCFTKEKVEQNKNQNISSLLNEECILNSNHDDYKNSKSLLYDDDNDRVMYPPTATIDLLHDHTQWQAHIPDVVAPKKKKHVHEPTTKSTNHQQQQHILQIHQPYFFDVALTLPETDINRELGIFMVEIDLKTNHHQNQDDTSSPIVVASSSRLSMLPYESSYLSLARQTLFMIPYLLGAIPQARTVVVKCFDKYFEAANYPLRTIEIRLVVPNLRHFPQTIRSIQVINAELRIGKELNLIQTMMKEWFYTTASCTIIALMFFYGCILCLVQIYLSSKHHHHHRSKTNGQFQQHQQRHWSQNLHGMTDELFQNYPNQSHGIIVGETDTEFDDFYGDDFEPDDLDSFHDSQSQISSTKVNKSLLGSEKKISTTETTTNLQSKVDDENNKSLHKLTNTKEQMKKTNSQMHTSSHAKLDDHDDEMNKIGIQRIMSGEFEPYEVFTGKSEDF